MPHILTVPEIANMIGVDQGIIQRTLERRDENLSAYLHEPHHDQTADASETGEVPSSQPQGILLDVEGLPLLITKLAFNIPTADIIENLACQVLHLTLLEDEKKDLAHKNQELQRLTEQQQRYIKELQQKVEVLQAEVAAHAEAASRRGLRRFFAPRKSQNT